MERLIFPHLDTVERIRILEDNAYKIIDNYEYDYVLTPEEVTEEEHIHAQQSIEITRLEEEKAALMKELSDQLKQKKEVAAATLEKIRSGRDRVIERVFVLEDDLSGAHGTYNCHGQLVAETSPKKGQMKSLFTVKGGDGSAENPYKVNAG